jgi:hypothetical protein
MTKTALRLFGACLALGWLLCAVSARAQTTNAPNYKALIIAATGHISCESMQHDHVALTMRVVDGALRYAARSVSMSTLVLTPLTWLTPTDWHVQSLGSEIQSRMKDAPDRLLAPAYFSLLASLDLMRATRTGADAAQEAWVFPPMPARTAIEGASLPVPYSMCATVAPRADSVVSAGSSNQGVLSNEHITVAGSALMLNTVPYADIGATGTTVTVTVSNARGQSASRSFALSLVHQNAPPK